MTGDLTAVARCVAGDSSAVRDVWLVHGLGSTGRLTFDGSGWLRALQPLADDVARPARLWLVELPGHADYDDALAESSAVRSSAPWLGDALRQLIEENSAPQGEPWARAVVGYSFGGRLAWEVSGVVDRVVIGGLPKTDPSHEVRSAVLAAAGQDPADNAELARLLEAITAQPFSGANPPRVPTLIAFGEKDDVAHDAAELAATVPGVRELVIPGRSHMNAVSARAFKEAAADLLS